jgi:hypothetical protein
MPTEIVDPNKPELRNQANGNAAKTKKIKNNKTGV